MFPSNRQSRASNNHRKRAWSVFRVAKQTTTITVYCLSTKYDKSCSCHTENNVAGLSKSTFYYVIEEKGK